MNSILPSIMQSIKPQYCELIAAGKKTIEVRKTKPKLKPPFKVYIYCTKDGFYGLQSKSNPALKTNASGKIIGEYVCDRIQEYPYVEGEEVGEMAYDIITVEGDATCLTYPEFAKYGNGKTLYGYHISNLKIYDKPKELSAFKGHKRMWYGSSYFPLTRPPQSWCYVEAI